MNDAKKRRVTDANAGPGTLISSGCKIEGTLSGNGNYMVSGTIEGDCDISGTVTVAKEGRWHGTIKADSVIIAGTVEGEVHALGKVEISNTARISGTISSDAIAVAEGAIIDGVMRTTGHNEPTRFVEKRQADEESSAAAEDGESEDA
jgi:cytoskeletal protein CcmA (bactofilin family)